MEIKTNLTKENLRDNEQIVSKVLQTAIGSKLFGYHEFLGDLVTKACLTVTGSDSSSSFNVDNVRICKILGGGLFQSTMIPGMVLKREVESEITKINQARIAVFSCPIDIQVTETKGTVLLKSADELLAFSKDEENSIESQIKALADGGINVIVSGGKVGEMALHFLNKYKIMAVRLMSKF